MKPRNLLLLLTLFSFCSLTSCVSNELSRSQAKELVTAFYEYPNVETSDFKLGFLLGNPNKGLIDQGYLYINKSNPFNWTVSSTSAGKEYQLGNSDLFITSVREFNDITGILFQDEQKTKAKIDFTIRRTQVTPFGQHRGFYDSQLQDFSVDAAKYDDGWRITSERVRNYKIEDFPIFSGQSTSSGPVKSPVDISQEFIGSWTEEGYQDINIDLNSGSNFKIELSENHEEGRVYRWYLQLVGNTLSGKSKHLGRTKLSIDESGSLIYENDEGYKTKFTRKEDKKPEFADFNAPNYYYAWVDKLRIRNAPSPNAKTIGALKEGERVHHIFELDAPIHYFKSTLRGKEINAPWMKIKTDNGLVGYVWGGGLKK